jgi:hypothetical protein
MPGYVEQALKRLRITKAKRTTNSPAQCVPPKYGQKVQYSHIDTSEQLSPERAKFIQRVCGIFLYYARTVDPTMLTAILKISSAQSKPTVEVEQAVHHFLQYAASNPSSTITYHRSDMKLIIHSDASYLSESKSRSRAGGFFYLSNKGNPIEAKVNGAIECISTILPTVCASAHEAEYAALFINGKRAIQTRNTLADLGFPQESTPILGDNETSLGVATGKKKMRRSQSMDMRYNWIKDKSTQLIFNLLWISGKLNLADYFTKIHPAHHYITMRNTYVADQNSDIC